MDHLLPFLGIALVVAAMLQFGLWTGRGLRLRSLENRKFEIEMEKLRAEIYQIRKQSSQHSEASNPETRPQNTVLPQPAGRLTKQLAPGDWSGYRTFVVGKLVKETELCTSVYLVPSDGKPIVAWQPGQHLTLRFPIPGQTRDPVRCYTLSEAPNEGYYRISVKKALGQRDQPQTPDGLVSSFVNGQLIEGSTIDVKSPNGSFFLQPGTSPVVLLAGGIGITPMLAILNDIARSDAGRECLLLYGVRNGPDHTFKKHLASLAANHPNIHIINCYSSPVDGDQPETDYQINGFVSIDVMKHILPNPDFDFYLCGPPPFMQSLFAGLTDWGVDENRIRFEAFGPATLRKKRAASGPNPQLNESINVRFHNSERSATWNGSHQNLLEFMEEVDIPVESGCRAGNCGTCITRLLSGAVEYDLADEIECEPGCCLPCVARPTEAIEIDA